MDKTRDNCVVSIITPIYNCEQFLQETIKSVLEQTYTKWELILIDDCSTDNSLSIAEEAAKKDNRIRVIRLDQNSGPAIARNTGIEKAKSKYIAFLDSDDMWLPNKLEKQISFMEENQIPFTYTAYEKIDEDGSLRGIISVPEKVTYKELLNTNVIGCLTAIYNTEQLGKVYMPNIRKRQDYGLWLKILKKGIIAYGINEPLARYRVRRDSVSSNKLKAAQYQWKIYRQVEKLGYIRSIYHFISYAYHGYKKHMI